MVLSLEVAQEDLNSRGFCEEGNKLRNVNVRKDDGEVN